jgi:hypothetical protein
VSSPPFARRELERKATECDHAIDALAAALEMASNRWPVTPRRSLPRESVREGWILGVDPPTMKGAL